MATDEKRRIVYELLVEAKGLAKETDKAKKELIDFDQIAKNARNTVMRMFVGFSVIEITRGLANAVGEIRSLTSELRVLGQSGDEVEANIRTLQDIAVSTGTSLRTVANSYKDLTDAGELIGLKQEEIAELTKAATIAMKAQGGTAEQAAQQITVMAFAIEKGTITGKELKGLLRDNEVLQRAFEVALGATTAELLEQANAGKIGADELRRVLDVYKELGLQTELPTTLATVTTSLIEQAKAFGVAAVESSKLLVVLRAMGDLMPENADSAREWGDAVGDAIFNMLPHWAKMTVLALEAKEAADKAKKAAQDAATASAAAREAKIKEEHALAKKIEEDQGVFKGFKQEADTAREQRIALAQSNMAIGLRNQIQTLDVSSQIEVSYTKQLAVQEDLIDAEALKKSIIDEQAEAFRAYLQVQEDARNETTEWMETVQAAGQVLAHVLMGLFTGATHNARDFFRSILEGFAELAAQQAIVEALGSVKGGTGFLGLFKKGAKGMALSQGVELFARGGVVGTPTAFGMSSGRMGVMGEAGPEGILPLKRMSDGKLGVGSQRPSVQVINQTGVRANARVSGTAERMQIILEAAEIGRTLAVAEVNRSMRTGYGATARNMQSTYGLRRKG